MPPPAYKFSRAWYLVFIIFLFNAVAFFTVLQVRPKDYLDLRFFDVGQGDAAYIRTIQGNDILVDTGPGDAILGKLGKAMPFADRTIELVILTHPHADHISGMLEILKRYKVQLVLLPNAVYESATYEALTKRLAEKGVSVRYARLGQRIFLDDSAVLDLYYPVVADSTSVPKDINDVSAVGKLTFGRSQIFLTGDAGQDIERLLLSLGLPLQAAILKVGHHGSRHSSSPEFLAAVRPRFAVISSGKNPYGHPHEETLQVLKESAAEILRTDERGDIIFQIYPQEISLSN